MLKSTSLLRVGSIVVALSAMPLLSHAAVVATVNGTEITSQDVEQYMKEHGIAPQQQGNDESKIVDELVARELVYQDALNQKLEDQPDVKQELANARRQVLLNAALSKAVGKNPATEVEMKKLYDDHVANVNPTEFRARHILVKDKETAEKLIAKLKKGSDFAKLAEKYSTGPTGKKGGELGWFSPQQMVPTFSAAVANLKKGQFTDKPVQTKFGWHVIQLEDTRKATPPSFDQLKSRLEKVVDQQHIQAYLQTLRKDAKVEIKK